MSELPFHCYASADQLRGAFADHPERQSRSEEDPGAPAVVFAFALRAPLGLTAALLDAPFSRSSDGVDASEEAEETLYFRGNEPFALEFLGLGNVLRLRMQSERPFEEAAQLLSATRLIVTDDLRPFVRFFGGGAFDPRRQHDERCWLNFGSGSLILPRILYIQGTDTAAFVVIGTREDMNSSLELLERVLFVTTNSSTSVAPALRVLGRRESVDQDVWSTMLGTAQTEMLEGRLSKVVAARRVTYQLSEAPRLSSIIARLKETTIDCAIFALKLGGKVFLGATPETLVRQVGSTVYTEALAGTRAISPTGDAAATGALLLESGKDRREHQFVVDAIREALQPHCAQLEVPEIPTPRSLRRMVHLHTAISGLLLSDLHVVQLVALLHPTPAVGGVPREAALDFISSQEPVERGWYAAPFGWCTPGGDGHFVVALRSALIAGDKAHLYAGAGIVRGSDAHLEYEETELKMSSILSALGLAS